MRSGGSAAPDNKGAVKKKKLRISVVFKSVSGIVLLLAVFTAAVCIMGYNSFTQALLEQYSDDAFYTALTAVSCIDADRIDAYAGSGGSTEEYREAWEKMSSLCNSSGVTFIYVIRPDLSDYRHITFLFSTVNSDSKYKVYDFGYVRETTNDEYREKYKRLYEGVSDRELEVRDTGYIETDHHITAMIPLRDSSGRTAAILCVQRQMENLVRVRNTYLNKVIGLLAVTAVLVIIVQSLYLHRVLLKPLKSITGEASRFAEENNAAGKKLQDIVKNNDEIGQLAASIDCMEERIIDYVNDLTAITAEKEKISTELSIAARIQAHMLPTDFPAFPERGEFDIFASMDPAKEVGGDFYDFFLTDDDHLCMMIADVSGKGVPAALFMMASRILLANIAKMGKSPSEILTAANNAICSNDKDDMFVTVWLGILEISTGRLTAANAGHESPLLRQGGTGEYVIYKDKHGLVLGGMEGISYRQYEIMLSPGSGIFLYTDGVPEATDSKNELFGMERLVSALNVKPDASPEQLLHNVRGAVDGFVKDAEQFDDLTMLCLEYKGGTAQ